MSSHASKKKQNRRLALVFVLVMLLLVSLVFWRLFTKADTHSLPGPMTKISGTILKPALVLPTINLAGSNGLVFTNESLKGHYSFLFFGFADCPYVCPTTLAQLNIMLKILRSDGVKPGDLPRIAMISVDPERDSVARMHDYVTGFNPDFLGLRTTLPKTLALANAMHVSFAKIAAAGSSPGQYTMTHTATIMVVNPRGQLVAYLSYPHTASVMAKDYRVILRATAHS